jgi:hypothetical protein
VSEAYKAVYDLRIGIDHDEDVNKMEVWTNQIGSEKECKKGEVAKTIGKIIEKGHYQFLCEQKSRGHQFVTFRNSAVSNFYVGNSKAPLSNSIIRFALRARNEILWTPARKAQIFGLEKHDPYCKCSNHRVCNTLHILNNCNYHMVEMTRRHNMVQERLVEAIKKCRKLKNDDFRNNQTVNFDKFECLGDIDLREHNMLRPDLQFWIPLGDENKKKKI